MEAEKHEELVKDVVGVVQMTLDHLNIPDKRGLREEKVSFVFKVCGGLEFAFIRLSPDLALCFRSNDKGKTFFLAGACDEMEMKDWAKAASQTFTALECEFSWRRPSDLDRFLSNLQSLFTSN